MKRTAKFHFSQDRAGEWRWRLQASNGKTVAVGESHATLAKAVRAADGVKRAAVEATLTGAAYKPLAKPISKRVHKPIAKQVLSKPAVKSVEKKQPTKPAVKSVRR